MSQNLTPQQVADLLRKGAISARTAAVALNAYRTVWDATHRAGGIGSQPGPESASGAATRAAPPPSQKGKPTRVQEIAARLDQKLQRGVPDWAAVDAGAQIAATRVVPERYQKELGWGGAWQAKDLDAEERALLAQLQAEAEAEQRTRQAQVAQQLVAQGQTPAAQGGM